MRLLTLHCFFMALITIFHVFSSIYSYLSLLLSHFVFVFIFFHAFLTTRLFHNLQYLIRLYYNLLVTLHYKNTSQFTTKEKVSRELLPTQCPNVFVVQSMSFSFLLIKLLSFQFLIRLQTKRPFFQLMLSHHILINILSLSNILVHTKDVRQLSCLTSLV